MATSHSAGRYKCNGVQFSVLYTVVPMSTIAAACQRWIFAQKLRWFGRYRSHKYRGVEALEEEKGRTRGTGSRFDNGAGTYIIKFNKRINTTSVFLVCSRVVSLETSHM